MLQYRIIPVTPFEQNCSLVWDDAGGDAVLIDPGGDLERLQAAVEQQGVHLREIWLTHGHIDHAGQAGELARRTGVPIVGPQAEDLFWLEMLPQQALRFGFPAVESFRPTRWLEDGERLRVGSLEFTVRHVPGHTPGHVVFHQAEARRCWVGDVLFDGSIGRTDFPRGNHQQLIDGIRQRLWPMGDDTVFIPGHGPESTFGEQRRRNPYVADTP